MLDGIFVNLYSVQFIWSDLISTKVWSNPSWKSSTALNPKKQHIVISILSFSTAYIALTELGQIWFETSDRDIYFQPVIAIQTVSCSRSER